jgi:hypothetical protein
VVSVDAPLVGECANDIQAMLAGWVNHSLVPGSTAVFDFDPGEQVGGDRDPDGEGSAGQARVAVLGSVGGEFGGAKDHIVCPRAALKNLPQVSTYSADMLGTAGIDDA